MFNRLQNWLNPKPQPAPQPQRLTAVEYEQRWMALLEQVTQGATAEQVKAALADLDPQVLVEWVWGWSKGLQPGEHLHFAEPLARLAELEDGNVGWVAQEISKSLQGTLTRQEISSSPTESVAVEDSKQPSLADTFWEQGNEQFLAGNFQEAIASYDKALQIKPDKHEAWHNRGVALVNLGDFEGAIASYDKALQIKPDKHEAWYNRGVALGKLGDFEGALTKFCEAIASYDKALQFKPDYHEAWVNRGIALRELGDFEGAIASYDKALQIKPDDHKAWFNRGSALDDLGDFEGALTKFCEAIASYDKALQFKPDYHEAWVNRGIALRELGDFEGAIASYDKALQIKPDDHEAWYNRGVALGKLGDFEGALTKFCEAIASYDKALQFKSDFHEAWVNRGLALDELGDFEGAIASYDKALQFKPDFHEAWYNRGIALRELGNIEGAIASYDKALQFKPDLHGAWGNRGSAVLSSQGLRQFSLDTSPVAHLLASPSPNQLSPSLQGRGYRGQVITLETGLSHVQPGSEGWVFLQRALGQAHFNQGRREQQLAHNPTTFWRKAQTCLAQALTVQGYPKLKLQTLQLLIRVLLAQGQTTAAQAQRKIAIELFQSLINEAPSIPLKRQLEAEFSGLSRIAVDVWLQAHEPIIALETAERYKNRCLTWILEAWQETVISPTFAEIQTLCTPQTAVIYWHLSPDNLTTFILTHPSSPPQVLATDTISQAAQFTTWLKDWQTDYRNYTSQKFDPSSPSQAHPWRKTLSPRLEKLQAILQIPQIRAQLPPNITHLILIPHQELHLLPLHTLFGETFTTTYLPSAQIGLNLKCRSHEPANYAPLLSVTDPKTDQNPMPFAQLESALVRHLITPASHLAREAATATAVINQLKQPFRTFHFTGHGFYNPRKPEDSALALTNGNLTAKMIRELQLSDYQLVVLAACETALTGQDITTEYVGFDSAFLKAGARNVLSTLWPVDEVASTWLIVRFYQFLLTGDPPATALHKTQHWMQTTTWAELITWMTQLTQLPGLAEGTDLLNARIKNTQTEGNIMGLDQPTTYSHPYYWAGFTLTGQG